MVSPTFSPPRAGFTLLEICIGLAIIAIIIGVATPSLQGVANQRRKQESFEQFNRLAQDAHAKSLSERRAYILIWSPTKDGRGEMRIVLRPDVPENQQEAEGLTELRFPLADAPTVRFPASLLRGEPAAIWIFWPNGCCEPADVRCHAKGGKWSALYNPFTAQAEVSYD